MLMLYSARIVASRDGTDFRKTQMSLQGTVAHDPNPFVTTARMKTQAFQIFAEDPALFLKTYAVGIVRMFVNLNTRGVARALGTETKELVITKHESASAHIDAFRATRGSVHIAIGAVTAFYLLMLYGATAWGFAAWCRAPDRMGWLCLGGALLFIALAGSAGLARFLLPAMLFFLYFTRLPTSNSNRIHSPA